jgi:hypothetical protein
MAMTGDEARVAHAFCAWLEAHGWSVQTEQAHCDVVATRSGQMLFGEAKGRTVSPGLDVDTLYAGRSLLSSSVWLSDRVVGLTDSGLGV